MFTLRKTYPGEPNYEDYYTVHLDGLPVGTISRSPAVSKEQWLWSINIHIPRRGHSGDADSIEAAKAAFKTRWDETMKTVAPEEWAEEVKRLKRSE